MKLLLDHNLSYRLVAALADAYPGSQHVRNVGLERAPDTRIWDFARANGLTIVSKDSDFRQRSLLHGFPPKIVWLRLGNCSTREVERLLRRRLDDVERFHDDATAAYLILS